MCIRDRATVPPPRFKKGPTPGVAFAAAVYAALMSSTAAFRRGSSVNLHTVLPPPPPVYAASRSYIVPLTSAHVTPIAEPAISQVPIFQVITDRGMSLIPASDRITKPSPDVPRSTSSGPSFTSVNSKLAVTVLLAFIITVVEVLLRLATSPVQLTK